MQYRYIGKSGLRVTPICLGTMTFGTSADKKESFKIMDKAYDMGINFFDTAELYPVPPSGEYAGLTEEIIGEWLQTKPRDSIILASKVAGAANGWFVPPIRHGLTAIDRFHITKALENTLKRLKTDYIDLYQVHWPDMSVPIEESLYVLDEFVKQGKIRYIGTSNDSAYGLTKSNEVSKFKNLTRFQSIQNNFSMLNRRFMDELSNVCRKENISLLPYSPLAGGVLTGKYNQKFYPENARFAKYLNNPNPRIQAQAKRFVNDKTLSSVEEYLKIAKEYDVSLTTLATAWSMHFDFIASTIIGASNADQLDDTLAAFEYKISDELMRKLDAVHEDILYPMG
ncbi:aldo/keto reductase [Sulfurospirillum arcachonense]|uniref:aldo/keto reductase n=1 Tax=Sulfurospirillum arcachonense TaxID=57666 RepID=UPI000467F7ED|nr:aldo/keto reductase [Sulfurospirillum arcachonense]